MKTVDVDVKIDTTTNKMLHRYLSLDKFVKMLETKSLFLSNISKWEDPWETSLWKIPMSIHGQPVKAEDEIHKLFGICWTTIPDSDGLWRIYSPLKDGVMISVQSEIFSNPLLLSSKNHQLEVTECLLGQVDYETLSKHGEFTIESPLELTLLKRKNFEHEKEVRLATFCKNAPMGTEGISFDIEPKSFISEIIVDPRANEVVFEGINTYCEKNGLSSKVKRSSLYSDVTFEGEIIWS